MPKLLLVRHGRTHLQQEDRYWGSTDVPLNDVGIKQAELLRDRLSEEKITHVYTSTLSRTKDTAKIIAPLKKETTACPEMNEFNFGYAEGLTYEEIKKLHPSLAEELARMEEISFPGGESLDKFFVRTKAFLKRLEPHKQNDVILIVGHAGTLRTLICHLLEMQPKQWFRMRVDYASLSVINMYPNISIIDFLNDTHHLKPQDF